MNLFHLGVNAAFALRKRSILILRDQDPLPKQLQRQKNALLEEARQIYRRHFQQTKEDVAALDKKYKEPVIGPLPIWNLMQLLAQCIDQSDPNLYCVSQLVHSLQVAEGMENDGIDSDDLIIAALVHDLGKILLLTTESPESVVCSNTPIGDYEPEVGLDNCTFQWNHDQFVYSRLRPVVPDHLAWLLRYHSINLAQCDHLMNHRDRLYTDRYLRIFQKYDKCTKSLYHLPKKRLENYRLLITRYFPDPIKF